MKFIEQKINFKTQPISRTGSISLRSRSNPMDYIWRRMTGAGRRRPKPVSAKDYAASWSMISFFLLSSHTSAQRSLQKWSRSMRETWLIWNGKETAARSLRETKPENSSSKKELRRGNNVQLYMRKNRTIESGYGNSHLVIDYVGSTLFIRL